MGALLTQDQGQGFQPVAYESRKLSPAECNYPVYERELLAILHALRAFRHYIEGRHVHIYTDHAALVHFETQPQLSPRKFVGKLNSQTTISQSTTSPAKTKAADALSRRPDLYLGTFTHLHPANALLAEIKQAYSADPLFHPDRQRSSSYTHKNGLWYFSNHDGQHRPRQQVHPQPTS